MSQKRRSSTTEYKVDAMTKEVDAAKWLSSDAHDVAVAINLYSGVSIELPAH